MDSKLASTIAEGLKGKAGGPVDIAIVCGSGLSHLSEALADPVVVKYESIPGFPVPTVNGHKAELVFGTLGGKRVVCMRGRFHTYEGYDIQRTALPIAVFKYLEVKALIVTNAAGGLNPNFEVGDFMVIQDHLNIPGLAGKHPLVGKNDEKLGPRFPPMSDCYYKPLRNLALTAAKDLGFPGRVKTGTYVFVSGPTYESGSESHFLYNAGADAVGMSTIPETVVAHYCGLKVLGISLITNKSIIDPDDKNVASHAEVLEATGGDNQKRMQELIKTVIERYDPEDITSIPDVKTSGRRPGVSDLVKRVESLESSLRFLTLGCGILTLMLSLPMLARIYDPKGTRK